jgi:hypothetical protein
MEGINPLPCLMRNIHNQIEYLLFKNRLKFNILYDGQRWDRRVK